MSMNAIQKFGYAGFVSEKLLSPQLQGQVDCKLNTASDASVGHIDQIFEYFRSPKGYFESQFCWGGDMPWKNGRTSLFHKLTGWKRLEPAKYFKAYWIGREASQLQPPTLHDWCQVVCTPLLQFSWLPLSDRYEIASVLQSALNNGFECSARVGAW